MNECVLAIFKLSLKGFSYTLFNFAWGWADSPNNDSNDFCSKCVTDCSRAASGTKCWHGEAKIEIVVCSLSIS